MAMHPLMKPASWAVWSGSGGIPTVQRAAAIFWLAGTAMLAAWLVGLWHEALVWGASPLLLISGLSVALVWCWLAWSTWSAWREDRAQLTLIWTGPVREAQDEAGVGPIRMGGFRLAQWDAAVGVEVLLDLQQWMLLRVTAHGAAPRQSWLWLEATPRGPLHQLRTLVYLPAHLTQATGESAGREGRSAPRLLRAVASWAYSFKSGPKLRPPVTSLRASQGASTLSLASESAFPPTLVMREEDALDPCASGGAGERA